MVKTTFNSSSHRRDVLVQIVERYLHKRRDDSRQEDSENLKDIKAIQELMWQELGRRVEGFPKSPFKRTFRRLTAAQVQFHLVCKGRLISCAVFHWKDCNDFIHLKRTDGLNWLLGGDVRENILRTVMVCRLTPRYIYGSCYIFGWFWCHQRGPNIPLYGSPCVSASHF